MYALCYIVGMISVSVFMYAVIIRNRKNRQEAFLASGTTFAVIAILGIIKWVMM